MGETIHIVNQQNFKRRWFGRLIAKNFPLNRNVLLLPLCAYVLLSAHFSLAEVEKSTPPQKGQFAMRLRAEPSNLHPYLNPDWGMLKIMAWTMDSLAVRNLNSMEWVPRLAEKWELSKDQKILSISLRKNSTFHNGQKIAASDVRFSLMHAADPQLGALHLSPYLQAIEKIEVLSEDSLRIYFKERYFGNLATVLGHPILPEKVYQDAATSKGLTQKFVGAGPYLFDSYDRGNRLKLKKFRDWYGFQLDSLKGLFNFDRVIFRFVPDETIAIEMIKKGELDFSEISVESFSRLRLKDLSPDSAFVKVAVDNRVTRAVSMFGFNLKKKMFQDLKLRRALMSSLNRDEFNQKFRFGLAEPLAGFVHPKSPFALPGKAVLFDLKKSAEALRQAGWKKDKDGILEKKIDGELTKLSFSIAGANKDQEKYFLLWQEDLKKIGVDLQIKTFEWATLFKKIKSADFDMMAIQWFPSLDSDPKQMWHSNSIGNGGSNFVSYSNPKVDRQIEKARMELEENQRTKLFQQIYKQIADDLPYLPNLADRQLFYLVSKKIGRPQDTFEFEIGETTWWENP